MVELEFLERSQRPVALLGELEAASLESVRLIQPVLGRRKPRPAQERKCDNDDAGYGEHDPER